MNVALSDMNLECREVTPPGKFTAEVGSLCLHGFGIEKKPNAQLHYRHILNAQVIMGTKGSIGRFVGKPPHQRWWRKADG